MCLILFLICSVSTFLFSGSQACFLILRHRIHQTQTCSDMLLLLHIIFFCYQFKALSIIVDLLLSLFCIVTHCFRRQEFSASTSCLQLCFVWVCANFLFLPILCFTIPTVFFISFCSILNKQPFVCPSTLARPLTADSHAFNGTLTHLLTLATRFVRSCVLKSTLVWFKYAAFRTTPSRCAGHVAYSHPICLCLSHCQHRTMFVSISWSLSDCCWLVSLCAVKGSRRHCALAFASSLQVSQVHLQSSRRKPPHSDSVSTRKT